MICLAYIFLDMPYPLLTTPISKPGEKLVYPVAKLAPINLLEVENGQQEDKIADFPPAITEPLESRVVSAAKKLTHENAVKSSYEISIKLHEKLNYRVGEALGIFVQNTDSEVNYLLDRLSLNMLGEPISDPDQIYEIAGVSVPDFLPKFTSIRNLLKNYLELRWPALSKGFIISCIANCRDENQKLKLQEIASKNYRKEYLKFFLQEKLTLIDFLRHFDAVVVSISQVLSFIPRLKYRWYSACNAPKDDRIVKFCFAESKFGDHVENTQN